MTSTTTNAAAGDRGVVENDLGLGSISITPNIIANPLSLQVSRLLARFAWSEARARAVAEIAFDHGSPA